GEAETSQQFDPQGIAPNAQLVLMSDISLDSVNLMAAFDDCLYLGADIINTSFGVSGATAIEERLYIPDCESINNIINNGIMFCASAGNDGKLKVFENNYLDYSTGGYPNNISGVMSVGSAENYFKETSAITVNENQFEIINSEDNISIVFNGETLEYVPVPGV
ncbi:MAG: S8 family serine peptidase, partial [Oscillospiraceae bacterium]|nr:S8 family serine peptidase [Oscillospiraceae bacterium]